MTSYWGTVTNLDYTLLPSKEVLEVDCLWQYSLVYEVVIDVVVDLAEKTASWVHSRKLGKATLVQS